MLYDAESEDLWDRLEYAKLMQRYASGYRSLFTRDRFSNELTISLIFTIPPGAYDRVNSKHLDNQLKRRDKFKGDVPEGVKSEIKDSLQTAAYKCLTDNPDSNSKLDHIDLPQRGCGGCG